jgi:small subunit ribosomal protein S5
MAEEISKTPQTNEKENGADKTPAEITPEKTPTESIPETQMSEALQNWVPRTKMGRDVMEGRIKDIDEILDKLVPGMKNDLILIGGRTGKGGGIQRIPARITAKMTKSGRRFNYSAFVVVGNEDGLVGIGKGNGPETRSAIAKAIARAKMNVIRIKQGCGSWECGCGTGHSIPFKVRGKAGSVTVDLLPAPKGVGLVADDQSKKILKLAGIRDVWVKTFGNTSMRLNLIAAIFDALKKVYVYERE